MTSHYLNRWWPSLVMYIWVTQSRWDKDNNGEIWSKMCTAYLKYRFVWHNTGWHGIFFRRSIYTQSVTILKIIGFHLSPVRTALHAKHASLKAQPEIHLYNPWESYISLGEIYFVRYHRYISYIQINFVRISWKWGVTNRKYKFCTRE